jgi:hypothetical protein
VPRPAHRSLATVAGIAGLLTTGAVLAPAATAGPPPAEVCTSTATTVTCTYAFTGAQQEFVVPSGVSAVDVVAIGGVGGSGLTPADLAQPARVTGTLDVLPGSTLYVLVGGNGGDASEAEDGATAVGGAPGWNGGGWGGEARTSAGNRSESGAGGGGASDVRTVSDAEPGTLDSRVLVAAGSGGGSHLREGGWGDLNGWTLDGYGASAAAMGTTTAGGSAGNLWGWWGGDGGYGVGGTGRGMPPTAGNGGGGGGGGVHGGGGGAVESSGAGGGSLAPAGGTTGWSATDHAGSITVSYARPPHPAPAPDPQPAPPAAPATTAPAAGAVAATVAETRIVPGAAQTIRGTGFTPGETVHGWLYSTPIYLGTQIADADGVVVFTAVLPAGFEIGTHHAELTGSSGYVARVEFTVSAPEPAAAGRELARTGFDGRATLVAGGLAVAAGAVLIASSIRRRPTV